MFAPSGAARPRLISTIIATRIAEGACWPVETDEGSLLMLGFPLSEDALLIGLASNDQVV